MNLKALCYRASLAALIAGIVGVTAGSAGAAGIIDQWSSVTAPTAPPLQAVTVDPATTAVLALDFVPQTCNAKARPRCVSSLPTVAQLIKNARAAKALVVYSGVVTSTGPADVLPPVGPPAPGDPFVKSHADKFLDTNLAEILKSHNIKTVIVTGTTAQGAVLYTGSHAALEGMQVVIPVDGMSAEALYPEQYVAWNFLNAPLGKVQLTAVNMITFKAGG